ncbi:hypothetical protein J2S00_002424 [Caldalkalibacillus uzonensis]|uniref:Uncharacterized protein n=1 Tax=Caldalkalibacillus uzonensis TaxID=353224 RepID=A0ABU0CT98_9BACI|nr:hypothetical protein [Caldalkalibacillus uzonensis]MDQ0339636.1 hypothetical protein [Caldalkalibacillus uzonensis]
MDFIEFIMGNFMFFLILLWILSSLFGRRERGRNEQPRPVRRPPQQETTWDREETWEHDRPWEKVDESQGQRGKEPWTGQWEEQPDLTTIESEQSETYREQHRLSENQRRAKELDLSDAKVAANEIGSMAEGLAGLKPEQRISQEARDWLDFKRMTDKSVVKGYIWSEIFGKPRAKQPHALYARYRQLPRR